MSRESPAKNSKESIVVLDKSSPSSTPPPSTPKPQQRYYQSVPVPFWFRAASASAFRSIPVLPSDVFLSSAVKSGTTWAHRILRSLLHVFDDDGNRRVEVVEGVGARGQAYPDALPLDRGEEERGSSKFAREHFGDFTLGDLLEQPEPRMFSTHLFGKDFLPEGLIGDIGEDGDGDGEEGKGRLVIVLRNLKDVMVSLHYFMGEPKDGWYGNEHGPGSFARFLADDTTNAFGSTFSWIQAQDALVALLQRQANRHHRTKSRVLVLYYEAMHADLPTQLGRINDFLDLPPLTDAKRRAVVDECTFRTMKEASAADGKFSLTQVILRKGAVGDWKNHLTPEDWARLDDTFDRTLGTLSIARPLAFYQIGNDRDGLPDLRREQCTPDTDPRTWPVFRRMTLEDGAMLPDLQIAHKKDARFVRSPSEYLGTVPSTRYPAQTGRYHIFASGICPWAQSVVAAHHLLGLQNIISLDIADGQSSRGWVYLDGTTVAPWAGRPGPFYLYEAYRANDPNVTTRITVPVLWDTTTNSVVSNDSWTIVKMLSDGFGGMGDPSPSIAPLLDTDEEGRVTLIPPSRGAAMEDVHDDVYGALLNGVYRAGLGYMQSGDVESDQVRVERETVYSKLAELEDGVLSRRRFLMGSYLTAVDVRLAMTLLRWDSSYRGAFCLSGGRGGVLVGDGDECGYPNLRAFVRDVYRVLEPVVDFTAFRQYYRIRQSLRAVHRSLHPEEGEEGKGDAEDMPPLADLREIIASAKEPAGPRPVE